MKKHGGAIVFVVILMVVGFFFFKDELHIDIKNPFAGKSEVPDSVVEEMLAEYDKLRDKMTGMERRAARTPIGFKRQTH